MSTDSSSPSPILSFFAWLNDHLGKSVGNAFNDYRPARGCAALPGRTERALYRGRNRQFQIGVIQNDERILPAHFALYLDHALGSLRVKPRADLIRAGEGNGSDGRVIYQTLADSPAASQDHVQAAGRESCFPKNFHHQTSRYRSQRRGFEDDGVSRYQGRGNFPAGDGDRKIPGRHDRDHPKGLPNRVTKIVFQL